MKILLFGEFSGVHNNLKKGLIELGHEVKLAADGDGFKKFGYDFPIISFNGFYLGRILNLLYMLININKFIGYDVIQFISPFSLPTYIYKLGLLKLIVKKNKKVIYYACGSDPNYTGNAKLLDYHPTNGEKKFSQRRLEYHRWFIKQVDMIVPATYSYYLGYRNENKITNYIMLPGNGNYITQIKKPENKLKILFGITRRDFKGVEYIEEAIKKLEKDYPNRIEIKIVERMPFDEYTKMLDEFDILIDQCKSYFYGMNAIFSMQRGLIVLSGNEKDAIKYTGINEIPVINIVPDSNQIYKELKKLVELSNEEIWKLKMRSLSYVEKYHDIKVISKRFENIYQN